MPGSTNTAPRCDGASCHTCSVRQPLRGPPLRSGRDPQGMAGRRATVARSLTLRAPASLAHTPAAPVAPLRARAPMTHHRGATLRSGAVPPFMRQARRDHHVRHRQHRHSGTLRHRHRLPEREALRCNARARRVRPPRHLGPRRRHRRGERGVPHPRHGRRPRRLPARRRAREPALGLRQLPRRPGAKARPKASTASRRSSATSRARRTAAR